MAVLSLTSIQLTRPVGGQSNQIRLYPTENYGKRRIQSFEVTAVQTAAAGDAGSTIDLVRLPMGRVRLHPGESKIWCSAGGAGVTMQLGIRAYKYQNAGEQLQADDPVALAASIDVSAALNNAVVNAALWKYDLFPTQGVPVPALLALSGSTPGIPEGSIGPHIFATFPQGFPAGFLLRGHIGLITD